MLLGRSIAVLGPDEINWQQGGAPFEALLKPMRPMVIMAGFRDSG